MKKNIIVLVTKLSNGGAERAALILAENLSKYYNVYLTVFDNSHQDYKTNLNVINLNTKISNSIFKKIFYFFKRISLLKKMKREKNIDCTISFLTGCNLVNILSKQKDKVIVSIRNNIKEKGKLEEIINEYVVKKADKIVTVSEKMRKDHMKEYRLDSRKIVSIPNVVNYEKIQKLSEEKIDQYNTIFQDGKVVVTLGRFILQKGQWHLIRSFSKVIKKYPDYKLVIFGRGKNKDYYQSLIQDLNLNKNVFILEFVQNPYQYLKQSKIYVMPSLYEGCSNAILEAMACELPIIASDCDYGNRELLGRKQDEPITGKTHEEYGVLVPVCDRKYYKAEDELTKEEIILYDALMEMIENDELREKYKRKSIERIKDYLDNTNEWMKCIEGQIEESK